MLIYVFNGEVWGSYSKYNARLLHTAQKQSPEMLFKTQLQHNDRSSHSQRIQSSCSVKSLHMQSEVLTDDFL